MDEGDSRHLQVSGAAGETQIADILAYFADLADASKPASLNLATRKKDFALLDWPMLKIESVRPQARPAPPAERLQDQAILEATTASEPDDGRTFRMKTLSPVAKKLFAVDHLHGNESLLRLGWLFLVGRMTVDGETRRVFLPLISSPVEATADGDGVEIVVDSDFSVQRRVLDRPDRRLMEKRLPLVLPQLTSNVRTAAPDQSAAVQSFIREIAQMIGCDVPPILPTDDHPYDHRDRSDLVVCSGAGLYLSRDVTFPDAAGMLREWAQAPLATTALARLYASSAPTPGERATNVASVLPLNRAQAAAVAASRTQPIVTITGPPGTGKSHTVAAIAFDAVANGESVLVATRSDAASDVLERLFAAQPAPFWVRFGKTSRRWKAVDAVIEAITLAPDRNEGRGDFQKAETEMNEVASDVIRHLAVRAAMEGALDRRRTHGPVAGLVDVPDDVPMDELERLVALVYETDGWFSRWRARRADKKLRTLMNASSHASMVDLERALVMIGDERMITRAMEMSSHDLGGGWVRLEAATDEWRASFGEHLDRLQVDRSRNQSHRHVATLSTALRAGSHRRREMLRELRGGPLLSVLPLWLGTLGEIDDFLPVEAGSFDLVILDEASQIDQQIAVAALARASRAVIVGDSRQLRHVSFVSDEHMRVAARHRALAADTAVLADVRRNSVFDVATSHGMTALEEHFRSVPHVIGFSAERFYNERLRLMTQHPSTERMDAIDMVAVDGKRVDGVNEAEVGAVCGLIRDLADQGERSVGIVTPFRPQAEALEAAVLDQFTVSAVGRLDLRIGTVHGFQGDERDVMIISLGIGPEDGASTIRFIEDANLFNVMITRARHRNIVVTSVDRANLAEGLIKDYLEYSESAPQPFDRSAVADGWIGEIAASLKQRGLRVVIDYPVAGWTIDLAAGEGSRAVGVECAVHQDGPEAHIERHLALRRAGWRILDAHEARFLADADAAAEYIATELLKMPEGPDGV